uniref:Uncharacterized protein n=1 Tax=Anguilla anguilla TaxID=7936 RepID=A0A0E9W3Q5_ANGAN
MGTSTNSLQLSFLFVGIHDRSCLI